MSATLRSGRAAAHRLGSVFFRTPCKKSVGISYVQQQRVLPPRFGSPLEFSGVGRLRVAAVRDVPRPAKDSGDKNIAVSAAKLDELYEEEYNEEEDEFESFSSLLDDEDSKPKETIRVDATAIDDSLKVENMGLSTETVKALKDRGIHALFPIQKSVYQPIAEGRDVIGRARTGSGKTLAFALPVIESLIAEDKIEKPKRGRYPRGLIVAPTRELANQVAREFETACPNLKVASFYGGVSAGPQMGELERGVDVVVGTPGRIMDLMERGKLVLEKVRFSILDEADQMLDMGFQEDMERILGGCPPKRQTLLFSATLPSWVTRVARRFQKDPVLVDLVGEQNTGKLAESIRCLIMLVGHNQKQQALNDLLSVHSNGKAMVFTRTKLGADEVAQGLSLPCEALHGDIPQAARESSLSRFREGRFSVLVATDVAARGLDIPNVDLVVHYDMPQDAESFLHRSGRTGRAGKTGTAVVLYTDREARELGRMLKDTKTTHAEQCAPPDAAAVLQSASKSVLQRLDKVDEQVIGFFMPAAEKLLASGHPNRVLAAALASMSGFRSLPQPRSILTGEEGRVTCQLLSQRIRVGDLTALLREINKLAALAGDKTVYDRTDIGRLMILEEDEDGFSGVAFDIKAGKAEKLLAAAAVVGDRSACVIDRPESLLVDVNELVRGRGGPPRADSSSRSWGNDRAGGYGRDRGDRGGSGGYSRDRGAGGWGSQSYGGGAGSSRGSSWEQRGSQGRDGDKRRSDGGWGERSSSGTGSWGQRSGGSSSGGGGSGSWGQRSGGSSGSWGQPSRPSRPAGAGGSKNPPGWEQY